LDFGFAAALKFFPDNLMILEANGTPLSLVTRAPCKTLLSAQRQREQALMHPGFGEELLLTYVEPDDVTRAKTKLLEWSRETQADDMVRFRRCMEAAGVETAMESGTTKQVRFGTTATAPRDTSGTYDRKLPMTPTTAPSVKREPKSPSIYLIDKKMWDTSYGAIGVSGNKNTLCWYHSNRPGGCRNSNCINDHTSYPTFYGGLPFASLSADKQRSVLNECKRN